MTDERKTTAQRFSSASGTAVSCVLKSKYPEKIIVPIFILNYKGPVEVGGLALACDVMGVDGLAVTMGDKPKFGEAVKFFDGSEKARDWMKANIKMKNIKLGCLVTARKSVEETLERVRDPAWDFVYFMRLEDKTFPVLEEVAKECKKLNKPIYSYFLVGTPKNLKRSNDWLASNCTMDKVEEQALKLDGLVYGIIATCAVT